MKMSSLAALPPILVVGGGGHAKVVIEAVRAAGGSVVGVVDKKCSREQILGAPVLGGDEVLERLRNEGVVAAVVAIGDNILRAQIGARVSALGFTLATIIHPSALASPSSKIGAGVVLMARSVVGCETVVEELAIVNTGAILDHDNWLGFAAHVAPGCALAGNVQVGARTLVGVGSSIRPNVSIGKNVVVGAGSSVVKDVPDDVVIGGTPAKLLSRPSTWTAVRP